MPAFKVVIPARHASSRLPGKPLLEIGGVPMVVRVARQAQRSGADEVWVATDHADIATAVREAGFQAVMTREDHPSGTDRLAEVAQLRGWADDVIVVNLQGDEPLMAPELLSQLAQALHEDPAAAIATASHAIDSTETLFNPNVVKVVCDAQSRALYFSRAPIPWARDAFAVQREALPEGLPVQRHIGVYAYRCSFLRAYSALAPAPLEAWEALEQLRALWHGYPIRVVTVAQAPAAGVDTEQDLARVRRIVERSEGA